MAAGPPDSKPVKGSLESLSFLVLGTRENTELAESCRLFPPPVPASVAVVTKKQGAILFFTGTGPGRDGQKDKPGSAGRIQGPFRREACCLFLRQRGSRSRRGPSGRCGDQESPGCRARSGSPGTLARQAGGGRVIHSCSGFTGHLSTCFAASCPLEGKALLGPKESGGLSSAWSGTPPRASLTLLCARP